jgi:putative membrane protein
MTEDNQTPQKSANELAAERTNLAVQRTVAAHDRTLIAWVRTAVSLISFGFTIYKFFEAFTEKGIQPTFGLLSPRKLGILMLALGFISLLFATIQNHIELKKLRELYPEVKISFPVSIVLAVLIALLALFLLILALFRQ